MDPTLPRSKPCNLSGETDVWFFIGDNRSSVYKYYIGVNDESSMFSAPLVNFAGETVDSTFSIPF